MKSNDSLLDEECAVYLSLCVCFLFLFLCCLVLPLLLFGFDPWCMVIISFVVFFCVSLLILLFCFCFVSF